MPQPVAAETTDQRHRAQFAAVRNRVFDEMTRSSARWRLTWILPFQAAILLILVVRDEALWRVATQGVAIVAMFSVFLLQGRIPVKQFKFGSLFVGAISCFAMAAVTGGLASPLLPACTMVLFGASTAVTDRRWLRPTFLVFYCALALGLALLARTPCGRLATPLTPVDGWSTPEYVAISLISLVFIAFSIYQMGCRITRAHEQVALELWERREELCTENEDRTKALEGIAARLAHEVKNPLAAIKGLSVHMARTSTDPKVAERLSIVAQEADRVQSILDGFLSFSRGLDDLKVAATNPHQVARELALLLETRAADHGVTLDVGGSADLSVNADARKLRQALMNLVLNAMQASPTGASVDINVDKTGRDGIEIRVKDHGAGMPPEVLDRIRKPYFTTKEGGSGLGVAVARGLIEQHGGQLRYESAPGKGTTAIIALPWCSMHKCNALPSPLKKVPEPVPSDVSVEAAAR
jgi:two-component system, NtrC family, sensor histidine kinase HydH